MSEANGWISCQERLPEIGVVVETKIDDGRGCRNEGTLKRGGQNGKLWFFPDGSMYIYYEPTHWRPSAPSGSEPERKV